MKTFAFVIGLISVMILPQAAMADQHGHHRGHEARRGGKIVVVDTRPHRHRSHHDAAGPMIAGGIAGGIIGYQLGSEYDRETFALLGTLIGAAVGHDLADGRHHKRHYSYRKRHHHARYHHHRPHHRHYYHY